MKKTFILILLIMVTAYLFSIDTDSKLSNQLIEKILQTNADEFISVNIFFNEQPDFGILHNQIKNLSKSQKLDETKRYLKTFAQSSQNEAINLLYNLKLENSVKGIISIFINNVLHAQMKSSAIKTLSEIGNVALIDYDEYQKMVEIPETSYYVSGKDREITWNVSKVNANDVWGMGYTGENVLVAIIDTGVNYNHHDLENHMWENNDYPYHGYDFVNNDNNPIDDMGHGTHCAGTVAGDGTSGSQTGMAPNATIMALKVLSADGSGSEGGVWTAMNFALDHNANVISMSLGWQHSWGPNRTAWRNAMVALNEAGIVAAVAAGNEGDQEYSYPIPDNVRTPGDCPPPWLHPNQTLTGGTSAVVSVGATNSSDNVSGFSGRGPCEWENVNQFNDYPYQPEIGLIRPDIVAPGANIKSLNYQNNSGYLDGWDGTSMATPCVAGVFALMLSKNSTLIPAQLDEIVEETAVHFTTNKSNISGSGRIDALAAVNSVPEPTSPPNNVINPFPEDNSTNQMTAVTFTWANAVGGGIPEYFKFYLGTNNPPTNLINGDVVNENTYQLATPLEFGNTYYWKVEAYNEYGNSDGDVWNFSTILQPDEDFETADFSAYPWGFSGTADWEIDPENAISGSYSAKSGNIYNNQSSALEIQLDVSENSEILFWKKVSSEENFDKLKFYIDNQVIAEWSGDSDWSQEVFPVSIGTHIFKWKYLKLNGGDEGEDSAWIDYVVFPITGTIEPAHLEINPSEIIAEMPPASILTETLQLTNTGGENLTYTISESSVWITIDNPSGILAPGESNDILVNFYSTVLPEGIYDAEITINDDRAETVVPVHLTVVQVSENNDVVSLHNVNLSNYPNPFNPSTTISFNILNAGNAKLEIYNIKGELVDILANSYLNKGTHTFHWRADKYASGIYFGKLKISGKHIATKKMILMK